MTEAQAGTEQKGLIAEAAAFCLEEAVGWTAGEDAAGCHKYVERYRDLKSGLRKQS